MKEFLVRQGKGNTGQGSRSRGNTLPPPLGIIEVIHATSISVNISCQRGILSVATLFEIKVVDLLKSCEILKYSQVYEPYRSIVGQERGQTHKDLNERRKIKSNLYQINPNLV